ncbi:COQ7 protein [Rickenella mellea]|uniref:5-demethoxyubiquinone hydroxylase, mitochondrial n=1 Tax=Rickenella mellea TaxID=50990 RepID=A0A4Y7QIL1_9AGAM|nr:COQ7 protein [Rickenella mellea]
MLTCTRTQWRNAPLAYRCLWNHAAASSTYLDTTQALNPAVHDTPDHLRASQFDLLDKALRVDQAGEVAANWIYRGQMSVLGRDSSSKSIIQSMWEQEKKHLAVMNKLQIQHRIRPTALWEVAKIAGFALGACTALLGREAAMACTEAVETVIGEHYDDQLKEMEFLPGSHPSISMLDNLVREFRDDELEHLDIAIENHSQRAPGHALLSAAVASGCEAAIAICKVI